MFKHLSKFTNIVVTGPQRAGTRITTKMIAHDTGLEYIDEKRLSHDDPFDSLLEHLDRGGVVVHCPRLCSKAHEVQHPNTLIVLMVRPLDEIQASQDRINWGHNEIVELERYGLTEGCIAKVKYDYWEATQKPLIEHYLEIKHDSLREHPLFLEKGERQGFAWDQTQNKGIKLNLGCGGNGLDGYTNIDIRATAATDMVLDVQVLPFEDESIDHIEAHHIIEHLKDGEAALANWTAKLKPGGTIIIECPNASALIENVWMKTREIDSLWRLWGKTNFDENRHLAGYDRPKIERLFKANGLEITHIGFGTRGQPVEINCLRVEGVKI